jgi:hypothetical protein
MRFFKTILIATAMMVGLSAASASALVTIEHTNDAIGVVDQGGTFNVFVDVHYDGVHLEDPLSGVFQSASWDPTELSLISATAAPFVIFCGGTGCLTKISDPGNFEGDPADRSIRTVQFGANPGQFGSAGSEFITTLTFQVIGGLDGVANVDVAQLSGDEVQGGGGFSGIGTSVDYVPVPEPGTALLMGLGLAGLGYAGRRNA